MAQLLSLNVGRAEPNPYKDTRVTGHGKRAVAEAEVRAPGPKHGGLGSGLVGDFIGDRGHHGGDDQAVYAFAREDLDRWQQALDRELPSGCFGENLTTVGIDVNEALVGERWRIGEEVVLQVSCPRIPCSTFRGMMDVPGWLKRFTADQRPGTYLRVVVPGTIRSGDPIEVVHVPQHTVTVARYFAALTLRQDLLPGLVEAGDDLPQETRDDITALARR